MAYRATMHDHHVQPGDRGVIFQDDEEGHEIPVRVEVIEVLTVPVPASAMGGSAMVASTVGYRVRRRDDGEIVKVHADAQWAPDP